MPAQKEPLPMKVLFALSLLLCNCGAAPQIEPDGIAACTNVDAGIEQIPITPVGPDSFDVGVDCDGIQAVPLGRFQAVFPGSQSPFDTVGITLDECGETILHTVGPAPSPREIPGLIVGEFLYALSKVQSENYLREKAFLFVDRTITVYGGMRRNVPVSMETCDVMNSGRSRGITLTPPSKQKTWRSWVVTAASQGTQMSEPSK